MRSKFNFTSVILFALTFVALSSAQATFNETSITTPIQNIRHILEIAGGGITIVAIVWGLISFILGKREALGRIVAIIIAGTIIFAVGPALEYFTGNAAFNG